MLQEQSILTRCKRGWLLPSFRITQGPCQNKDPPPIPNQRRVRDPSGEHLFSLTGSPAASGRRAMFGGVHAIDCSPTVIKETVERGRGTFGTE